MTTKSMASEAAPATPGTMRHVADMIIAQVHPMVEKYLDSEEGGKMIIDRGTEVNDEVRDFVRDLVRKHGTRNQFANEEAKSKYVYPPEFKGPRPIENQIVSLATRFGLDARSAITYAANLPELPEGAEGWFAFPRAITRDMVLGKLAEARSFYNYRANAMNQFRVHSRTALGLDQLAAQQENGDILVAAVQLGMRHRGRSTRRARECFVRNEFGLHTVGGGAIALTHPERFVRWEELDMDLPGDEFDDAVSDVRFDRAAYLVFGVWLRFGTERCGSADDVFGSASFFLPQA